MLQPRQKTFRSLSAHGFHRVVYREWGHPACPRVVVCVHGLTRNGRDFDALASALADRFRLLCPDVPGRGDSEWLADSRDYVFPTYLTTLTALVARSGADTVDWVGTSMGGLLGIVMAAQPKSPIARLVVNDVGPTIEPAAIERIRGYFGLDPTFATYQEIEQYIRASGLPATILRPTFFMEIFRMPFFRQMILEGTWTFALRPETKVQMIATDDIGALVALVLEHPQDFVAKALEIAGDELTMPRAAEVLVEGRRAKLVRRRESVGDLLRAER